MYCEYNTSDVLCRDTVDYETLNVRKDLLSSAWRSFQAVAIYDLYCCCCCHYIVACIVRQLIASIGGMLLRARLIQTGQHRSVEENSTGATWQSATGRIEECVAEK